MKFELEPHDIEVIASKIADILKPMLLKSGRSEAGDKIFNKRELAQYLGVKVSWVDKKVSLKDIPYFKVGKYPKFRKSKIDKWIDSQTVNPIPPLKVIKIVR